MQEINVTEFRSNLPSYLSRVLDGEELLLTSRGKAIARLVPVSDERLRAREQLVILREKCRIDDVESPLAEKWEAAS
ncbi:MAG: type II toxin-antitoxin system prevent-host-death family antitoxin [Smithellaceae bacterium]|nr:type II toxin-antitoxin system prevent-host-death family antitoxin [Smithellaceae bacterium]